MSPTCASSKPAPAASYELAAGGFHTTGKRASRDATREPKPLPGSVTEQALPVAIEAREQARAAHKRLDGINGSVANLNTKFDTVNEKLDNRWEALDEKVTSVLITLATAEGEKRARSGFIDSKRFAAGLVVALLTSSVAAMVLALVWRHH